MDKSDEKIEEMFYEHLQGSDGLTKEKASDALFRLGQNPTAVDFVRFWPEKATEINLEDFTRFYRQLGNAEKNIEDALDIVFDHVDKDHNGILTKEELTAFLDAADVYGSDIAGCSKDAEKEKDTEMINQIFKDCDRDGSGGLSKKEFINIIQNGGWNPELYAPEDC